MSLPPGRKLFAERVDLALIEEMEAFAGVAKLTNPELASQLRVYYAEFQDVSRETRRALTGKKSLRPQLLSLFWSEFQEGIRLLPVKARLSFGKPPGVDPAAACTYELKSDEHGMRALASLQATPFLVDGVQRGIFDDISVFDVPSTWILDDGSISLEPISRFMSLGTTLSFYFPSPHHQRWYTFAKGHQLPPALRCDKKLSVVFNKPLSADVTSIVFGVELAHPVGGGTNSV